jgi:protocatechuate 3,4-dioxygenase beta subunit
MSNRISRRQALAGMGAVGLSSVIAACNGDDESGEPAAQSTEAARSTGTDPMEGAPSCSLTPEQTEGPFYFDADKIRSDIREGHDGAELRLRLRVQTVGDCKPIRDAVVDLWHCDAEGEYSSDPDTFCRGAQATNADGIAEFTTVYPGWYQGRTIHIHGKVHVDNSTVLTTQLTFDDDFTARVFESEPYAQRAGRDTFNEDDGIFDEATVMKVTEDGDGYLAVMNLNVAG